MTSRDDRKRLRRRIAEMQKCPTCGGFAIPSVTRPGAVVCNEHGVQAVPDDPQSNNPSGRAPS